MNINNLLVILILALIANLLKANHGMIGTRPILGFAPLNFSVLGNFPYPKAQPSIDAEHSVSNLVQLLACLSISFDKKGASCVRIPHVPIINGIVELISRRPHM
jgi:hypothetical protein